MSDSSMSYEPEDEEEEHGQNANKQLRRLKDSEVPLTPNRNFQSNSGSVDDGIPNPAPKQGARRRVKPRHLALRAAARLPVDKYLELYKESLNNVLVGPDCDGAPQLFRSQYGIIQWTSQEKAAFFMALSKKGKDAVPEIAASIGTKSQMEVRHYLDLLQRNFELRNVAEEQVHNIILSDIPAACEISNECCIALESVAKALCLRDEQTHNVAGKRKHGDFWLVDREIATFVEEDQESEAEAEPEEAEPDPILEPEPAPELGSLPDTEPPTGEDSSKNDSSVRTHGIFATAKLLKLSNWIHLSEHFFMNFGRERFEDNWNQLCFQDETPALTCDAFSDFYTLAISITRRVIQSSIFFALSRIRAVERSHVNPKRLVKKEDVSAALDVLGMAHDAKAFWAGVARRCALDVRHPKSGEKYKTVLLDYDEVERLLGAQLDENPRHIKLESPSASTTTEPTEDSDFDSNTSTYSPTQDNMGNDEDLSDPEELYANVMDREASRKEESALWAQINKPVPLSGMNIKLEPNEEEQNRPTTKRKSPQELVNWRDRLLYQSEWETLGQEINGGQRKRRKFGPAFSTDT
ncbi:predicted protein [Uncinocarpus reesii 1704]|uniref:Myb-like domain-containing protein n=1 Tax=Uncinocarpus reesii (strain UAMH 1704) TaxID=336963 RepID=C4JXJ2_UNCRE|nr:uncharacterized protein UREG_06365 [Uncinocarpus reesii 1704]EEP81500.1 predicted protein [Uncinocarpus reesii 1704]